MTASLTVYFAKKKPTFHFQMRHNYQHSIDFRINVTEINTRECKNSKMYIQKCKIGKCMSGFITI